jgi:hypothetical protein
MALGLAARSLFATRSLCDVVRLAAPWIAAFAARVFAALAFAARAFAAPAFAARAFAVLAFVTLAFAALAFAPNALIAAENLVFVTWDGFRWQEMFTGAEERLISKDFGGVSDVAAVRKAYWRETPEARREVLLPFVWSVLAKDGQLFGDPTRKAAARLTNGRKFSYPGYNEMFAGFADSGIDSNNKIPNPNLTVLEHIHRQPGFADRVAAFATWDVIEFVLNRERSRMPVQVAWNPLRDEPLTEGQRQVNAMINDLPRLWPGVAYDAIAQTAAREHLRKHRPRVLYIGLGETDEWAHARRYDQYLESARRADRSLREFWELLQSLPEYRGKTNLVLTTDHGRGFGRDWANHSATTEGAEFIWIGLLGPDVPALGVREGIEATQSQVAATLGKLVGVDFSNAVPQAAPPLNLAKP